MGNPIRVSGKPDIPAVMAYIEQSAISDSGRSGAGVCSLVCEELLLRLLNAGCADIEVSAGGHSVKYIEVRAPGERTDLLQSAGWEGKDGIESQISVCLLEQFADYFTFRYRRGVNEYRIYSGKQNSYDLTGEIFSFYRDADPDKPHRSTDVLRFIAGRHKGFFSLSVLLLLVKHLAALMLPVFVSNIINIVTETGVFFSFPVLLNISLSVVSLAVNLICFWVDSRYFRRFTRAVEAGFRMAIIQKLQTLSIRFHNNTQSGVILSKMISDVQFIQMLIYDRFQEILYMAEDVVFVIVVAILRYPLMLLFYFVLIPVVVLLLRRFMKRMQEKRAGMRQQNEQVGAAVKEMLEMESLVRAHGLGKTEYRSMLAKVRGAQRAAVLYDRQTVSVNNVAYGLFQGLRLLSLGVAALLTAMGHIQIGTLVLFQSIFEMILANVQRMLDAVPLITQGYDSLKSVNELLYAGDIEQNGTELLPNPVRGEIEFRNVSFRYEEEQEPVLQDISFKVPAGGSIAFMGKSGEGKTTILNLALGLYSPQKGEILADGKNLETLEKTAYRRHIAVVPQQTVLFSGTLWNNLVYGLPYVSKESVMDVIRQVGLEDLVEALPEGLNSPILENGGNLSGGQRQRIAIARALLRNPRIIIMDEATSALDQASEKQVQEAIDSMMGRCTVIMVAHRLNTLRHADAVYRVNNGSIERCEDVERL
ncbi:MAG: ABC transporter ATP-binding protein [Clostridia bacterium]|nr:ABC transporter ATP-binding protein [Clostridia bacterium]